MQHSVIHKYIVTPSPDVQELQVPVNSFIVSAVAYGGQIAMYVLKHNPDQPFVNTLQYLVIGTGWSLPNEGNAQFVSTVKTGQFVWHLFTVTDLPF
ncbi:hypothetical protein MKZ07_30175 [Paenibacillus sp. FSL P4-0338]|uniref:DUF7352 domain-containing protein n=1 Tax=Paenibacillus sp. FSL P4-0338 TaxID=2921635 RepID=UPI0030F9511A